MRLAPHLVQFARMVILTLSLFFIVSESSSQAPDFLIPDTICVNTPVNIANTSTSTNATSYYWNFCSGSLNLTPAGTNFSSPNLSMPVFMDIVQDGANFFVFVVNHTGSLARMDFGNSLTNSPSITDLGSFGGVIPWQAEGIEIKKDGSNWIGYIIGGQYANSRLLKLEFGSSVSNIPTATNLGNIGGLDFPVDFTLIKDGSNWYGFTVSADNNTVTRYSFGNSLNNMPTAVNLGNTGGLSYPVGLFLIKEGANYHLFIANRNNNSISRLDFGASVANTPAAANLGNPGNNLNTPRDITVIRDCDKTFGFVTNEVTNTVTRLDFNNDILSIPTTVNIGNIGNLSFPSSISEVFRTGNSANVFVPNVNSNSITRLTFNNCSASSIPSYIGTTPPAFQYTQPGDYNISLFVDEGLPTQSVICKKIVVLPRATLDFQYSLNGCQDPLRVEFTAVGDIYPSSYWSFGDNQYATNTSNPVHVYSAAGTYVVKYTVGNQACADTVIKTITVGISLDDIILTQDTTLCAGMTKQLRTVPSLDFCWSPATYLDNPLSANPTTNTPQNITYYFTAQVTGQNLITNGDFSQGNTGFTSEYLYNPTSGVNTGVYNAGSNILAWHPTMQPCGDHTMGNGNMMMVNGAQQPGVKVWQQTITVQPNTNYAFSAWLQHITSAGLNPALLQFSINDIPIGTPFQANNTPCLWERFYATWNAGSATTAQISIINQNQVANGNDFALDDLSFAAISIKRDSVVITVEDPVVRTNNDTTVCAGNQVSLNATGGTTYSWSPPAGLNDPGVGNPVASPTTTTQYIVTGTTANGCSAKDTVTIVINPNPTLVKSNDTTICKNTTVQLVVSGGGSYNWSPDPTLSSTTIGNPIASPLTSTTYYITVTGANTCNTDDSIRVNIHPDPQFTISPPVDICENKSTQLSAGGGNIYAWQPASSLSDPSIPNPVANPGATTQYAVQITETTCNNTTTLNTTVTVRSNPVVKATKNNDIDCSNDRSQLNASGAVQFLWTPAGSLSNPAISNPFATPTVTTQYIVMGTDAAGCSNYDSVTVEVSAAGISGYFMPNAFTPNHDGLNDCYGIKYWGLIQELEFSIFNRWGERIFFTRDPNACWDGTYKGVMQDIGVYVYMIRAKTFCGDTFKKGLFTLAR